MITEAADLAGDSIPMLHAKLAFLTAFKGVKRFEAERMGAFYQIYMIGSNYLVDPDYTPGDSVHDDPVDRAPTLPPRRKVKLDSSGRMIENEAELLMNEAVKTRRVKGQPRTSHETVRIRANPDQSFGWEHILDRHVQGTFNPAASKNSATIFKGSPEEYMNILQDAVGNPKFARQVQEGLIANETSIIVEVYSKQFRQNMRVIVEVDPLEIINMYGLDKTANKFWGVWKNGVIS